MSLHDRRSLLDTADNPILSWTKSTVQNVALGKDACVLMVYPNVDHAFIVALVVILHEINEEIQAASQFPSMMLMI
ncbi:LURP-one-related 15-like protein [Tanacetum coccineum]